MARSLSQSIALNAPVDAVWRALTTAEGLKQWFAIDAKVEPGVGGSVWLSWGPGSEGGSPIAIWEPNQHLRTEMDGSEPGLPFAIDYFLEAQGATTVLRIVTSGFGDGDDWDEMYTGMEAGWAFFLLNLQLALEQHPGMARAVASERRRLAGTRAEEWVRLRDGLGLSVTAKAGDQARFELAGQEVAGTVVLLKPERCIAIALPGLNRGMIMFEQEPGAVKWKLGAYLSLYGVPQATVDRHTAAFPATLTALVGPPVD